MPTKGWVSTLKYVINVNPSQFLKQQRNCMNILENTQRFEIEKMLSFNYDAFQYYSTY